MDARRLRFLAALIVFALWVAALGVLALRSGRNPPPRPGAAASRRACLARNGTPVPDGRVVDAVLSSRSRGA